MLLVEDNAPEDYTLLGNKYILIAEDVELNQFIARQILETWGMKVAIANNGKEAVDMVSKDQFERTSFSHGRKRRPKTDQGL